MKPVEFNKKQVIKYLIWTFAIAWMIQAGVGVLYHYDLVQIGQLTMSAMMFAPMLGVLLSGHGLRGLGWKPKFKGNVGRILFAWFAPAILTALGAGLYFLIFPAHFDISGAVMAAQYGDEMLEQLTAQGISYPLYILISLIACLTYAPVINIFVSLGEEVGWRGFLYPQLKARFGKIPGRLLGGVIWGMWHWPVIYLIGYEYGYDYFGYPFTGMLMFLMFTTAFGFLEDWIYETGGCIWLPSLLHGAINAIAALPLMICFTDTDAYRLLGPVPNGLIAGLPMVITAVVVALLEHKKG